MEPLIRKRDQVSPERKEEKTENPKVSTLIAFCLVCAPGSLDQVRFFPPEESLRSRENADADASPYLFPRPRPWRVGLFWSTLVVKYLRLTLACACANTNKISVNFFNSTRTHTRRSVRLSMHTRIFLFICRCCCRALDCNGFVGMKIFLYYYYSVFSPSLT